MKAATGFIGIIFLAAVLGACDSSAPGSAASHGGGHGAEEAEVVKGPHGGRLLVSDGFTLELSIFETGVPPEFRVWATLNGTPIPPNAVDLNIKLTRLGGKVDDINFAPQGDALRGDTVIYEPHSFVVTINAIHDGVRHSWEYDNFEGRTKIEAKVAEALGIETRIAGPVVLQETVEVYGRITENAERVSKVGARFAGVVKSVSVSLGQAVRRGQTLATIESNESLKRYEVRAPIAGVITQRDANTGEQAGASPLFTITDTSTVWAALSIFPADRGRINTGAPVTVRHAAGDLSAEGVIDTINITAEANQSVTARVVLDNRDGRFIPGSYVKASIKVAEHPVELAVKRTGLQAFRDFTVVYAKIGDEYEVRMLELGRQDSDWIEVLGGLDTGTRYVSENSYVIKADIEKSGAAHDH